MGKPNNASAALTQAEINARVIKEWGFLPHRGDIVGYINAEKAVYHFATVTDIDHQGHIHITHQKMAQLDNRNERALIRNDGIHKSILTPPIPEKHYVWCRLQQNGLSKKVKCSELIAKALELLNAWAEWHLTFDNSERTKALRNTRAATPVPTLDEMAQELKDEPFFLLRCAARALAFEEKRPPRQPIHGARCSMLTILAYQVAEISLTKGIEPIDNVRSKLQKNSLFSFENKPTTHVSDCHADLKWRSIAIEIAKNMGHYNLAEQFDQSIENNYKNRPRRKQEGYLPSLLFATANFQLPKSFDLHPRNTTPQALLAYMLDKNTPWVVVRDDRQNILTASTVKRKPNNKKGISPDEQARWDKTQTLQNDIGAPQPNGAAAP